MNGKKAKLLRKQALDCTVGEPLVAYVNKGKYRSDASGREIPRRLTDNCTRSVHQHLKVENTGQTR